MGRKTKPVDQAAANRLRQARKMAGLDSAAEAARAMGVKEATYSGHENGSRGFDKEDAARYARTFKIDPQWLLYGLGNPRGPGIVEKLIALSPELRRAAELHIDHLLAVEAKTRHKSG